MERLCTTKHSSHGLHTCSDDVIVGVLHQVRIEEASYQINIKTHQKNIAEVSDGRMWTCIITKQQLVLLIGGFSSVTLRNPSMNIAISVEWYSVPGDKFLVAIPIN